MNASHHSEIFERAVILPSTERDAWVSEACGDNASLRDLVCSLLRAHEEARSFMENTAPDLKPVGPS